MEREALAEAERAARRSASRARSSSSRARPAASSSPASGSPDSSGARSRRRSRPRARPRRSCTRSRACTATSGIVGSDDVAILLSKSGETDELLALLEHLKRIGVRIIAITGAADSTLGRHADVVLDAWVREEACPHDLAPTTSTTAALALGDALAVALLERKGFRREDFATLHPGGSLGPPAAHARGGGHGDRRRCPRCRRPPRCARRWCSSPSGAARSPSWTAQRKVIGVLTAGDLTRLMERERDFMDIRVDARDDPHAEDRARRRARRARSCIAWSSTASWRCPWSTMTIASWAWCTCTI